MSDKNRTSADANSEPAQGPAIDMRAITELAGEGAAGIDFISKVTGILLDDMAERVTRIGAMVAARDSAGVAATMHALKGSCGHVGATRLIALCGEVEQRARRGEIENIEPLIESMLAEAERVREAIVIYRSDLPA